MELQSVLRLPTGDKSTVAFLRSMAKQPHLGRSTNTPRTVFCTAFRRSDAGTFIAPDVVPLDEYNSPKAR